MVHSEYRLDRTVEVVAAGGLQVDNFNSKKSTEKAIMRQFFT